MRTIIATLAALGLLLTMVSASAGQEQSRERVIVVFKATATDPGGLTDELTRSVGGTVTHVYRHALNGFAAEVPVQAISGLRRNPNVAFVEIDQLASIAVQDLPTGIDRIEADKSPAAGIDGVEDLLDVDIAIIDTGIDLDHPDLNADATRATDCTPNGPCTDGLGDDDNGHGSHVAGSAAARDNNIGVVGVAPGSRLWSVKVLDSNGVGPISTIVAGIDWVTARADQIEVANMSLGCECFSPSMNTAIANSVAAGIAYVVAAGNNAKDASTFSPADHDDVITVSAMADFDGIGGGVGAETCRSDADETLANFSNFGPLVEIAAPGVCIESTSMNGGYATMSGTSMASPHVAGAAALYLAQNGAATPAAVSAALINAALPQSDPCGFRNERAGQGSTEPMLFINGPAFGGDATCDVATPPPPPPPPPTGAIDFTGYTIQPYGAGQDAGTATVSNGGATLELNGNAWKKIAFNYPVTPDTVIEFDFTSTSRGEIHGIGFDTDDSISANRTFRIYGTQNWGIPITPTYPGTGVTHYVIPVGQFYTGSFEFLTFTNDHDVANPTAHSRYSNVTIHEGTAPPPDTTPPAAPTGLVATAGDSQVGLDWTDSPEPDAASYRVFRSTVSGGPYALIATGLNSSAHTDTTVTNNTEYFYVVTAVDTTGNESANSAEVSATPTGPPPPSGAIDFTGYTIQPYGAGQDAGTSSVADGGATLELNGNAWKKIAFNYPVTPDTVIEFDFSSTSRGEIHGIGFDTDDSISSNRTFRIYGTQNWGIPITPTYPGSGVTHYVIPVGQFYTGSFGFLTFTNDHDVANPTAHSRYSNVTIHEGTAPPPDTTPPAAPLGLIATAGDSQVGLDWTDSPEPDAASYRVFRSTTSGGPYALIATGLNSSAHTDTTVTNNTTYYYVVTAVDTSNNESADSTEVSATPTPTGGDPNLVGWWKLDDGSGTTASDSSGFGRNATLVNGPVWTTGRIDGGLGFDGSNDRVDMDSTILNNTSNVTFATWLKTAKTGQQAIISGANSSNSNAFLVFMLSSTELRIYTEGTFRKWTIASIANNAWHHIAMTRNQTAGTVELFLDGVSQETRTTPLTALTIDPNGLVIGQEQDTVGGGYDTSQAFAGSLDDLRLYTRILTPTEINNLANP